MGKRADVREAVNRPAARTAEIATEHVLISAAADQSVRWQPGERLDQLFEERCATLRAAGQADHLAVDAGPLTLTYDELDSRANQLARHLRLSGARPGDRIALLFDQPVYSYIAMLAVLKIHAAYVPLDIGFPLDRLSYIVQDSGASRVLSLSGLRDRMPDFPVPCLYLDEEEGSIGTQDSGQLSAAEKGSAADQLAYIIYTSGSTGRPKGVAVDQAGICNFVRVASDVYGIRSDDRMYQGMTIAFDFSVEEIWVSWMAGATLIPKDGPGSLLGADLAEFLESRRVTALCCVPTLLATLEEDVPALRFLLVSGEACPQDLMLRWHRPGRRFLNVYGPTEATVTATWAVVDPFRPPTLGVPLPSYTAVILDPETDAILPAGSLGEIGLAGVGLARGYVNRADLTGKVFIPDFLGLANNPGGRIYRTGDLGRINADGEIEYHGRIDTQVKIRGYRVELAEIESVILQIPGVELAAVGTHSSEPGMIELVAYYSRRHTAEGLDEQSIQVHLRRSLPVYMVPVYFVELEAFPLLPSDKIDRKALPAPGPRFSATRTLESVPAATKQEALLAEALGEALGEPNVSATADFFADLGANSITMARFCSNVRKIAELPPVSIRETYLHPTIRALASALVPIDVDVPPAPAGTTHSTAYRRASDFEYVLCGTLQLLTMLIGAVSAGAVLVISMRYTLDAGSGLEMWLRSLLVVVVTFVAASVLPIAVKWLLIGRWTVREIPVWTLSYYRFWLVKSIVNISPLRLFGGSPLFVLYLRALGAKIGRGTMILSSDIPVCTDLLTIGGGTLIRKEAGYSTYRVVDGMIQTGTVTIGRDAFIGEGSVIDIGASIGNNAQLGHSSALYTGQHVPDNECWHGSPAEPTDANYAQAAPAQCGNVRRALYCVEIIVNRVLLAAPLGVFGLTAILPVLIGAIDLADPAFYLRLIVAAVTIFLTITLVSLMTILVVPRLLNLLLTPGRIYPLFGIHYTVYRTVAAMTNLQFFMMLTGDSSAIAHYLPLLGYKMPNRVQTGTNFGVSLKHENPYLSTVGSGTMVADGLSIMNAEFSNTSFKLLPVSIGANNFLGNGISFPPDARVGDNCLIATKAMVPVSGPIREGVGILGSPAFEIPRSVQRDTFFDEFKHGEAFREGLRGKNKHNAVTILFFLAARQGYTFAALLVTALAMDLALVVDEARGVQSGSNVDVLIGGAAVVIMTIFSVAYFATIEWASTGFKRMQPLFCSIYQRPFWRHERFWKLSGGAMLGMLNGTPFKAAMWRLLGVRVGRRLFDDGAGIPEKSIVTIGDDCTLNSQCLIQSHSMEDGAFKLEPTVIGHRATLGVGSFVHYGVVVGDDAIVEADSFVMKGAEVPAGARFGGNPAEALSVPGAAAVLT